MNSDLVILLIVVIMLVLGSGYYVLSQMTDICDRIIVKCKDIIKLLKKWTHEHFGPHDVLTKT